MARTIRTRTLVVQEDGQGLFIRHAGRVFRPDRDLRRDTADNRISLAAHAHLARAGLPVPPHRAEHLPHAAGQRVRASLDPATPRDSIGVFTPIDPDGAATREIWGDTLMPGAGNWVTWSDETAPLRRDATPEGETMPKGMRP